jgi:hypothetical protein
VVIPPQALMAVVPEKAKITAIVNALAKALMISSVSLF